jgi:hypothetical protein
MTDRKLLNILAVLLVMAGLVVGLSRTNATLAAAEGSEKIEGMLVDRFTAEGQADFIVRFSEQADLTAAYAMSGVERGQYVVDALTAAAERSQVNAKAVLDAQGLRYQTFIAGNDLYVWAGNLDVATTLAALPEVASIRATRTYYIDPVADTAMSVRWAGELLANNAYVSTGSSPEALAWGITYTHADQFWTAFGVQGDGIKVANIDTGVQWNHPALDQAFACGSNPSDPACWADPSNICGGSACDNNGHGTHTMGTMVADDDPSLTWQAGMAPNATWIACKGCESNSCSDYALNTCADWILAPGGSAANAPDVVNNSWGGGGGDPWYQAKVVAWRAAGIFPAFSAGNSGPSCSTLGSPGDYQESFGSAAIDSGGNIASFSSRGPSPVFGHDPYTKPNISAPGVSVCSTIPTNSWSCGYSGTSMASPHSAGAVALLWSCNPGLIGNIDLTFQALQNTAGAAPAGTCGAPPDGEGNYTFGYGYLDVLAAGITFCDYETGYLDGHVYDQNNTPIAGATVTATPVLDGSQIQVTTDPTGYYTVTLQVGTYDVTASKPNYTPQTVTGVVITSGDTTTQDFTLQEMISITPDPLEISVVLGNVVTLPAVIQNNLSTAYPFEFIEIPGSLLTQGSAPAGGGPDPYGYVWTDSNEAGGPVYEWIDATGGTPLNLADDGEANVTLPFAFNFYGVASTAIRVGNNGGVIFNATTGDLAVTNADLSLSGTATNLIVPFWDDIDSDTGNVYYATFGTAPHRIFVVEWYNRPHYSNVGNATFELILYEGTNNIKYQYQDVVFGNPSYDYGISATVGIRGLHPNYLQRSYNQAVIQNLYAICFTYPGSPPCDGGDIPWYATSITSGTVPASGSLGWTNTFSATLEAGITQPGTYTGELLVQPGNPGDPQKYVDVIMHVLPTGTLGLLDGTVTSDRPGGPIENALVEVEDSLGTVVTLTTDIDGYYSWYFETGTLTVTASAPGYLSQQVVINLSPAGYTQDFTLVLDAPEIVVSPESLEATLVYGDGTVELLNISNTGEQPLTFEIGERSGDYFPTANDILLMMDDVALADWNIYRAALSAAGVSWDEWNLDTLAFPTAGDLAPYSVLIWMDEDTIIAGDPECQIVADWLVSGDKSLFAGGIDFLWDLQNGTPGLGEHNLYLLLNTTYVGDYAGTTITTLDGVAGDLIGGDFTSPNQIILGGTADSNGDYASTSSIATTGLTWGPGGTGSGYAALTHYESPSFKTVWYGLNFHNGMTNQDQRNLLMENIMAFLYGGDVPWLSEAPITGTVPVAGTMDIDVTFDSSLVPSPGTYTAELRVNSDDPLNPSVTVPVTMTVLPSADLGLLEGAITGLGYCDGDSYPLEAEILIEDSMGMTWTVASDASGYYYKWLYEGTYTVTVSAPEHIAVSTTAVIVGQQTTTLDVALRYIESCLDVTPTSFSVTIPPDTQWIETLTLSNGGAGELIWSLAETTATLRTISIPPFEGMLPPDTAPLSLERAPNAAGNGEPGGMIINGMPANLVNLFTDSLYIIPDLDFPGTWSLVGTPGGTSLYAGDFAGGDFSTLYAIGDDAQMLYAINTETGVGTAIGPCVPTPSTQTWTGMSWDNTTNTMFASATDGTTATLYSINLSTGTPTVIANIVGAPYTIDIAVDAAGQMYGHDIQSDVLLTINKVTGATSVIGSTGFNANYAQGMDFDEENNILYLAAYNGTTSIGELRIADTSTGATILVGSFPGGAETDALGVQAGGMQWVDVPWVSENPESGTVIPDSSFDVEVIFDSTGLLPGCYYASLGLSHDDPGWEDPFMIPLELCVAEDYYAVDLEPETSAQTGAPGTMVEYTLQLENTGTLIDTIELTFAGVEPGWVVNLPVSSFELAPGEMVNVIIQVTIPVEAMNGDFDTFTVTATSLNDPAAFDDVGITTTVVYSGSFVYLPFIWK